MKVIYPGSFNPWHNGHQHVFDEACEIFGKENVYIGIAKNAGKGNNSGFIKFCLNSVTKNIVVIDGLVADYCKENNFSKIIRGIRQGYDLQLEEKLSHWNYEIGNVRTIYIPTPNDSMFVSSSFLREVRPYKNFEYLKQYMPEHVCGRWFYNTNTYLPIVYYGKSCVGKTIYLNSKLNSNLEYYQEGDKRVWEVLGWSEKKIKVYKCQMKEIINNDKHYYYYLYLKEIAEHIDWSEVFRRNFQSVISHESRYYKHFDFPVIGNYFDYIPDRIKYTMKYVKFITTPEKRLERIKKRGLDTEWIDKLDRFYQDPPFCDEVKEL